MLQSKAHQSRGSLQLRKHITSRHTGEHSGLHSFPSRVRRLPHLWLQKSCPLSRVYLLLHVRGSSTQGALDDEDLVIPHTGNAADWFSAFYCAVAPGPLRPCELFGLLARMRATPQPFGSMLRSHAGPIPATYQTGSVRVKNSNFDCLEMINIISDNHPRASTHSSWSVTSGRGRRTCHGGKPWWPALRLKCFEAGHHLQCTALRSGSFQRT